jgi:hypothetical protein
MSATILPAGMWILLIFLSSEIKWFGAQIKVKQA